MTQPHRTSSQATLAVIDAMGACGVTVYAMRTIAAGHWPGAAAYIEELRRAVAANLQALLASDHK